MAFTKITPEELRDKGVIGLPDAPELNTTEMQEKFDEIALDVIVPHFNDLVDELDIEHGDVSEAIEAEEDRAKEAEETLDGKIDDEIERATLAEGELSDAISSFDTSYMKKSVYDSDSDGVVDNSEALDGHNASYFATASALDGKVDKVAGKGLSTNDFTTAYKDQIDTNTSNIGNLSNLTTTAKDNLVVAINEAAQSGGGASDLDDLNDVNITSPTDGQVLKYNATSSKWENGAGGGGGASTLSDLTDTAINTPTSGQALVYSSVGKWTNVTLPSASGDMRKAVYDPDDDGIIGIAQGGTGNADGYIRTGKRSNSTVGTSATAEGSQTVASGSYSHAEGQSTTASGGYGSHSEGYATTASGGSAHAEGGSTIASGASSHAEGDQTSALSDMSHAEGFRTKVSTNAWAAHAEGYSQEDYKILASAYGAHAEGNTESTTYGIIASGKGAHAEGYLDSNATGDHVASGNGSHVEGYQNTASGAPSHAEGAGNTVSGGASHVEGMNNVAGYAMQHVQGQYNDNKRENVFEIGGGTANNRSNIFEIDENGYMSFDNGVNKIKFGVDANGNYGYIKAGADTVYPFSSGGFSRDNSVTLGTNRTTATFSYTNAPNSFIIRYDSGGFTISNNSYYVAYVVGYKTTWGVWNAYAYIAKGGSYSGTLKSTTYVTVTDDGSSITVQAKDSTGTVTYNFGSGAVSEFKADYSY